MTDDRLALLELIEKQADVDLVREMLAFAADRIMEVETEVRTGAAKGARSPWTGAGRERASGHASNGSPFRNIKRTYATCKGWTPNGVPPEPTGEAFYILPIAPWAP